MADVYYSNTALAPSYPFPSGKGQGVELCED